MGIVDAFLEKVSHGVKSFTANFGTGALWGAGSDQAQADYTKEMKDFEAHWDLREGRDNANQAGVNMARAVENGDFATAANELIGRQKSTEFLMSLGVPGTMANQIGDSLAQMIQQFLNSMGITKEGAPAHTDGTVKETNAKDHIAEKNLSSKEERIEQQNSVVTNEAATQEPTTGVNANDKALNKNQLPKEVEAATKAAAIPAKTAGVEVTASTSGISLPTATPAMPPAMPGNTLAVV